MTIKSKQGPSGTYHVIRPALDTGEKCVELHVGRVLQDFDRDIVYIAWIGNATTECINLKNLQNWNLKTRDWIEWSKSLAKQLGIRDVVLTDEAQVYNVPFSPYRFYKKGRSFYEDYGFRYCDPLKHAQITQYWSSVGKLRVWKVGDPHFLRYLEERVQMDPSEDLMVQLLILNATVADIYVHLFEALGNKQVPKQYRELYKRDLEELSLVIRAFSDEDDASLELMCLQVS